MKPLVFLLKTLLFGALLVSGKHGESEGGEEATTSSVSGVNSTTSPVASTSASSTPASSILTPTSSSLTPTSTISSTASSTPSPASTSVMQFSPPGNITTCTQATFAWSYNLSTSLNMTIIVTNERTTTQHFAAKLARRQAALVSQTLSTTVDARALTITWAQVDVPAGQYALVAFDTARTANISIQSDAFFVLTGADTSCLSVPASSSNSPSPSGSADQESTSPSPSQGGSKSLSTGALAGTIAGVLIGVGGLLVAFTLPRFRRHRRLTAQPPRPGAPYHLF